jgi:serine protease Do
MAFPICPGPGDNEAQFLIQDPFSLRRAILPLFEVDNQTQLLTGLGTAFRIDPYGAFLTAQHLVEHRISGHPHARGKGGAIIALVSPGMNLGRNQLPTDCFARLEQATTIVDRPDDPLAVLQGRKPKVRNVFDCMVMVFDPSNERLHRDRSFLPLRLRGRPLQVG